MRLRLVLGLTLLLAGPAAAADLTVAVKTADGRPVADAVVALKPASGGGPIRFPWPYVIEQRNIQFDPFVLIVPAGAQVSFPNRDKVRHHVYSFSGTKKFELKLYGREEARTVTFEKAGVVPLGCNIHDAMIAFIYVTDTRWTAKTNAAGEATLRDAPAGAGSLTIWHPYMKAARNQVVRPITLAASRREAVTVDLRPAHKH